MAKFHPNGKKTPWFEINWEELVSCTENPAPICDECLQSLIGCDEIILIPILNEAFCPKCGKMRLPLVHCYPEDRPIEIKRVQYYLDQFGLEAR